MIQILNRLFRFNRLRYKRSRKLCEDVFLRATRKCSEMFAFLFPDIRNCRLFFDEFISLSAVIGFCWKLRRWVAWSPLMLSLTLNVMTRPKHRLHHVNCNTLAVFLSWNWSECGGKTSQWAGLNVLNCCQQFRVFVSVCVTVKTWKSSNAISFCPDAGVVHETRK